MINRFIKDLNTDKMRESNKYSPTEYSEILDLSKRRDSVETRKTPSPYTTSSCYGGGSPNMEPSPAPPSTISPRPSSEHSMPYTTATYLSEHPAHRGNPAPLYYYQGHQISGNEDAANKHSLLHSQYHPQTVIETKPNLLHPFAAVLQQQMSRTSPAKSSATEPEDSKLEKLSGSNQSSSLHSISPLIYPNITNREGKIARPFKAYPRDPLAMAATFTATDALLDTQKAEKYSAFRKRMLEQIHASNGGHPTISNPKMRRNGSSGHAYHDEQANDSSSGNEDHNQSGNHSLCNSINQNGVLKDAAYYERRKKNNAAAKKSRDRRRIKEDEIAVRAAFLEHENIELRIELSAIKNQLAITLESRTQSKLRIYLILGFSIKREIWDTSY